MNVQYDAMVAKYGKDEAARRCDEIEAVGGFGDGRSRNVGGLDLTGLLAESNDTFTDKEKARVAELAGVSRKDLEKKIEAGRKAVAEGDRSKDHIIPPDMLADGEIQGQKVKDVLTR